VKIATTKAQRKLFFNLRRLKKNLGWLTDAETRAIAADLGVTAAEVTDMEQRLSSRDLSFDPAPDADDEDGAYSPSAYLPHPESDPSVAVEREQWDEDTTERLSQALETLDERSQNILRSRWMTDDKATLHELADKYGVSAERIRQIEANAIKKLRGIVAEPLDA
jgi:RNA polymerase sigma-32 factor